MSWFKFGFGKKKKDKPEEAEERNADPFPDKSNRHDEEHRATTKEPFVRPEKPGQENQEEEEEPKPFSRQNEIELREKKVLHMCLVPTRAVQIKA